MQPIRDKDNVHLPPVGNKKGRREEEEVDEVARKKLTEESSSLASGQDLTDRVSPSPPTPLNAALKARGKSSHELEERDEGEPRKRRGEGADVTDAEVSDWGDRPSLKEEAAFEEARELGLRDPEQLMHSFNELHITRQDHIVILVNLLVEKASNRLAGELAQCIPTFGIDPKTKQEELIALAESLAKKAPIQLAMNIHRFGIDANSRQEELFRLAKIAIERAPTEMIFMVGMSIRNFHIDVNSPAFIEIVELLFDRIPSMSRDLVLNTIFSNSGFDQNYLVILANRLVEKASDSLAGELVQYISTFGIDPKTKGEELLALAKVLAKKSPLSLARNIHHFGIDYNSRQEELFHIAEIAVKNASKEEILGVGLSLRNFHMHTDGQFIIKIVDLLLSKIPSEFRELFWNSLNEDPKVPPDFKIFMSARDMISKDPLRFLTNMPFSPLRTKNQGYLIRLAELCLDRILDRENLLSMYVNLFSHFGVVPTLCQEELIRLGYKLIDSAPALLPSFIRNSGLADSEEKEQLLQMSVLRKPLIFYKHRNEYDLDITTHFDRALKLGVLLKAALQDTPERISFIEYLESCSRVALEREVFVRAGRFLAEFYPVVLVDSIEGLVGKVGEDQKLLLELAQQVASKAPEQAIVYMNKVQIDREIHQEALLRIALLIAKAKGSYVWHFCSQLGLTTKTVEDALFDLLAAASSSPVSSGLDGSLLMDSDDVGKNLSDVKSMTDLLKRLDRAEALDRTKVPDFMVLKFTGAINSQREVFKEALLMSVDSWSLAFIRNLLVELRLNEDPDFLVKFLKKVSENRLALVVEQFKDFKINSSDYQDFVIDLAERYVKESPRKLARYISQLEINPEGHQEVLIKLAEAVAEAGPEPADLSKKNWFSKREAGLRSLSYLISYFKIDPQSGREALRKIGLKLAESETEYFCEYYEGFLPFLEREDIENLFETIVSHNLDSFDELIEKFDFTPDQRLQFRRDATFRAIKRGQVDMVYGEFKSLQIDPATEQAMLAEWALELARHGNDDVYYEGDYLFEDLLKMFQIDPRTGQETLKAIAEIRADVDPVRLPSYFENLKIDLVGQSEFVLKIVYKLAARAPEATLENLEVFGLRGVKEPRVLMDLAEIVGAANPETFVKYIHVFDIGKNISEEKLFKLTEIIAQTAPSDVLLNYVRHLNSKNVLDKWPIKEEVYRVITKYNPDVMPRILGAIKSGEEKKLQTIMGELIKNVTIRGIRDPYFIPILEVYLRNRGQSPFDKEFLSLDLKLKNLLLATWIERDPLALKKLFFEAGATSELIEFMRALKTNGEALSLLEIDYHTNHALPMHKKVLDLAAAHKDSASYLRLRLALQTHANFEEIERATKEGRIAEPLIRKELFFDLSPIQQTHLLCRAQVLREREALPLANHILKNVCSGQKVEEELLEMALKLYIKTGIEGSGMTVARLKQLVVSEESSLKIRILALEAIESIVADPDDVELKAFLIERLKIERELPVQIALLKALSSFRYQEEVRADLLVCLNSLAQTTPLDTTLKHALVNLLTLLPSEKALSLAYDLVNNRGEWEIPSLGQEVAIYGSFDSVTYRPIYHDSKENQNFIIGHRLVNLHWEALREKSEELYYKVYYKSVNPSFIKLARNLRDFNNTARYFPIPLFLPKNTVCFRGLSARKGKKLAEAAINDFFLKGSGSSDLSLFTTYESGTWAKIGQMFSSTTIEYVIREKFVDPEGVLMLIDAEAIEEAIFRRNIRLQREDSIHYVSYKAYSHYQISEIFMSSVRKPFMATLAKTPFKASQKSLSSSTIDKISRRGLERIHATIKAEKPASLQNRITYFNPGENLAEEAQKMHLKKEFISRLGSRKEASKEDIVKENLIRYLMLENVAEYLTDPLLKAAFATPPNVFNVR